MTTETKKNTGMNFGEAWAAMGEGLKVARAGWIQPGKWVRLVDNTGQSGPEGPLASYYEFKQGDGSLVPWTSTHNGMLSTDWYVVH